ncbi:GFA family protein [Paucibacter sp. AS339]|uniref:GFA family protein n=1 Tax=Paucibacter hankyongi TaxID=3133434 RepID=UPI0030956CBB
MMKQRIAACSCGQLSVTTRGEPRRVSVCHCLACQRRSGSVFAAQARFPRDAVQIQGESRQYTRTSDDGNGVVFSFCPQCGATVHYAVEGYDVDNIAIPVGAFADPTFPSPSVSVYEERMHRWVTMPGEMEHCA